MTNAFLAAASPAVSSSASASLPSSPIPAAPAPDRAAAIFRAAGPVLALLASGRPVDAGALRGILCEAFGGSDAQGLWNWKDAYEACETAQALFLRRYGAAMQQRAGDPAALLAMLEKIAALLPTHTKRSAEAQALQQLSTPIPLAFAAAQAAGLSPSDLVLEPSAGTGLLAIFAALAGAQIALNELADTRAALLGLTFPGVPVTRHDAAHIHDHLDAAVTPSVVLMNPPFSAGAKVEGRVAGADLRHVASALARLAEGGRLVAITGANLSPENPSWRDSFIRLQGKGRVVFSAAIDGRLYARHGTTVDTRLTVIDRFPADSADQFPPSLGKADDVATLLRWIEGHVPPRRPCTLPAPASSIAPALVRANGHRVLPRAAAPAAKPQTRAPDEDAAELAYETCEWQAAEAGRLTEAIYEPYGLQAIRIPGAQPHPTTLVQSAAMASVAPPKPSSSARAADRRARPVRSPAREHHLRGRSA